MPETDNIIFAEPSKTFFIDMLTRDITATQSILDLVDNSIHSIITETDIDVMQSLLGKASVKKVDASVSILLSKGKFQIEDTCGGISIKDAKNEVFRLGNPTVDKKHSGLGVYGIGMKRAVFKLGRDISVRSHTSDEEFLVEIPVDEWERTKDWNLEFTYARKRTRKGGKGGTTIVVKDLYGPIGNLFSLASFQKQLIRKLGAAYALFLSTGLQVSVNNTPVKALLPEFLRSKNLQPVRQFFKADGVDVLVLAGATPREDRQPRGWYIFCNGRMVVEADKTTLTGWGESLPQFHTKYNHFLGITYFRSSNLLSLPWTTTKDGVDRESAVYQQALARMGVLAKPILDFFNVMYAKDIAVEGKEQIDLIESARRVSVQSLARSTNKTWDARPRTPSADRRVSICYQRSQKQVNRVKESLGRPSMSNKAVGEYTFDYYVKKEG
jgi:hypothetical protein